MKLRDCLLKRAKCSNSQHDWLALKSLKEDPGDSKNGLCLRIYLAGGGGGGGGGVSYLEENWSIQMRDETAMAEVFNEHFLGLVGRLADKTVGPFDPTVLKASVDECKVSDSKLVFPPITPSQAHQLIKAILSGKAFALDGVSACLLKI